MKVKLESGHGKREFERIKLLKKYILVFDIRNYHYAEAIPWYKNIVINKNKGE